MKSEKHVRRLFERAEIRTDPAQDRAVLDRMLEAQRRAGATASASGVRRSWKTLRFAAAAMLLLGAGYLAGRLLAPRPDETQMRAWAAASAAEEMDRRMDALVGEIAGTMVREISQGVREAVAAAEARTNRRLIELAARIDATRAEDQRRVAAVVEQMEAERVTDRAQFGQGLIQLAAQTENILNRRYE